MSSVFDKKGDDIEKIKKEHEDEKEVLIKKIGELSMDVDYLKKSTNRFSNEEKKNMIEFHNPAISIRRQCELLGISRSTAYSKNKEKAPSQEEIQIKNIIDRIHYKEPSFGVRRMRNELLKLGYPVILKHYETKIANYFQHTNISFFIPSMSI